MQAFRHLQKSRYLRLATPGVLERAGGIHDEIIHESTRTRRPGRIQYLKISAIERESIRGHSGTKNGQRSISDIRRLDPTL